MIGDPFKHLIILLFIVACLFGVASITMNVLILRKKNTDFLKRLMNFNQAFFVVLLVNFILFYRGKFFLSQNISFILWFFLDIAFVTLGYYWIRLVSGYLSARQGIQRIVLLSSALYVGLWLVDYIFYIDPYYYAITNHIGTYLDIVADTSYFLPVGFIYFYCLLKNPELAGQRQTRNYLLGLGVMLSVYFTYLFLWDFDLAFYPGVLREWLEYPFDPILIIYMLSMMITYCLIYRQELSIIFAASEPVGQETVNNNSQINLAQIAERYMLTERETEMFGLVSLCQSNADISRDLHITNNTVKRHMNNIFRKIGVKNRLELLQLIKRG